MAKPKMVTRTMSTTQATLLCLDVESAEPENRTFTFPGTFKKDADILRAAAKLLEIEAPTIHAVHVVNVEVKEVLYGMTEADFIAHANELPARATTNTTEVSE